MPLGNGYIFQYNNAPYNLSTVAHHRKSAALTDIDFTIK